MPVLVLLFVGVPIVEIWVLLQVGNAVGIGETIALMILVSMVGAWLARHEGFIVVQRIRQQLEAGVMPGNELIDGALVLAGALLLLTPGFVTDALGIVALFPPTRAVLRTIVRRSFSSRVEVYRRDRW